MKKKVRGDEAYYGIGWSQLIPYQKHTANRILPEMAGIILFFEKKGSEMYPLLCFGCWREGLRAGIKQIFDPILGKYPELRARMTDRPIHFKYCVLDTSPHDMQDVMFWIIRNYQPELNSTTFTDSKRYREICVKEISLKNNEINFTVPGFYD